MKEPKVIDGSKMTQEEIQNLLNIDGMFKEEDLDLESQIIKHLESLTEKIEKFKEEDLDFSLWIDNPEILFSLGLKKAETIIEKNIEYQFEDLDIIPEFRRTTESFYGFDVYVDGFGVIADITFADKKIFMKSNMLTASYWNSRIAKLKDVEAELDKEYNSIPVNKFWYSSLKKEFYNNRRSEVNKEKLEIQRQIEVIENKKGLRNELILVFERLFDIFSEVEYKIFDANGDVQNEQRDYKKELYESVGVYL